MQLRNAYCCSLNVAVARRCFAIGEELTDDERLLARVAQLESILTRSQWTTPGIAFAYHAGLHRDLGRRWPQYLTSVVSELSQVAEAGVPAPRLGANLGNSEWVRFALSLFAADGARDGHAGSNITPLRVAARPHIELGPLLERLGEVWPAMAEAVQALVRVVVPVVPRKAGGAGPTSATAVQTFGAVFLADGQHPLVTLEGLVHEATHLDVLMRLATDPLLLAGSAVAASPFRRRQRPLTRVLHAGVVAARVSELYTRCAVIAAPHELARCDAGNRRAHAGLCQALESLRGTDCTPAGAALISQLEHDAARGPALAR
jgi:hypothetical protein